MRKLLFTLALFCLPLLAACTTIENPLAGLNENYSIEASVASVRRVGLEVMRTRTCRRSETASVVNVCVRHSVKVQIRAAEIKLERVLVPYRNFVDNNQTISALSAAVAVRNAISDYQSAVSTSGVAL